MVPPSLRSTAPHTLSHSRAGLLTPRVTARLRLDAMTHCFMFHYLLSFSCLALASSSDNNLIPLIPSFERYPHDHDHICIMHHHRPSFTLSLLIYLLFWNGFSLFSHLLFSLLGYTGASFVPFDFHFFWAILSAVVMRCNECWLGSGHNARTKLHCDDWWLNKSIVSGVFNCAIVLI